MKLRAPADTLWICGRVLRTGARPSGRVGSPWTTRSAESPSTGRFRRAFAHRLPTLARLSPTTPQLGNKFFFSKKRKVRTAKRGHFNFGEKGTFQLWVDRVNSWTCAGPDHPVVFARSRRPLKWAVAPAADQSK